MEIGKIEKVDVRHPYFVAQVNAGNVAVRTFINSSSHDADNLHCSPVGHYK